MKTILSILLISFVSITTALAQQQGSQCVTLAGGFSYTRNSNTEETPDVLSFEISPDYGYFIHNKIKIGLGLSFGYQTQKIPGQGDLKTKLFGAGPTLSIYFPIGEKFFITPNLSFALVFGNNTLNSISSSPLNYDSQDLKGFAGGLYPLQIEFRPKENFGIAVSMVSITLSHLEEDTTSKIKAEINQQTFDIGLNPSIGFCFYF